MIVKQFLVLFTEKQQIMSKPLVLRIQTPEGQIRLNLAPSSSATNLYSAIKEKCPKITKPFDLHTSRPASSKNIIRQTSRAKLNLSHGQQIFLFYSSGRNVAETKVSESDFLNTVREETQDKSNQKLNSIPESKLDEELWETEFKPKKSEENAAVSTSKIMHSVDDLSINPWDPEYLKSQDIKQMCFHAYMRMKKADVQNQKLVNLDHQILSKATNKDSNKLNISDLPTAITLARQNFRQVDEVVFENADIANNYIDYWRKTNCQRIGFLYGNYEKSDRFPLGVKAKVKVIYEPPQVSKTNEIVFENKEEMSVIHNMASLLGLERVGWIVSDLLVKDMSNGTVQNLRGADSHFITSQELLTAASFQLQHPNICRLSKNNFFGSKFVTVICSGDEENQVSFNAYQASIQCMDLVRSEIIVPTMDAPELAYVKESTDELYVPDIYYKEVDKYENAVKKLARPMPNDFLFTDMNVAMQQNQEYNFSHKNHNYPIENRNHVARDLREFAKYLKAVAGDGISAGMLINKFTEVFKNFHLLTWMCTADMIGCSPDNVANMIEIFHVEDEFKRKDKARELLESDSWKTLLEICREQNSFDMAGIDGDMDDDVSKAIARSLQDR